jgi:hypothetical protein
MVLYTDVQNIDPAVLICMYFYRLFGILSEIVDDFCDLGPPLK